MKKLLIGMLLLLSSISFADDCKLISTTALIDGEVKVEGSFINNYNAVRIDDCVNLANKELGQTVWYGNGEAKTINYVKFIFENAGKEAVGVIRLKK